MLVGVESLQSAVRFTRVETAYSMCPHLEQQVAQVEYQKQHGYSVTHGQKVRALGRIRECRVRPVIGGVDREVERRRNKNCNDGNQK